MKGRSFLIICEKTMRHLAGWVLMSLSLYAAADVCEPFDRERSAVLLERVSLGSERPKTIDISRRAERIDHSLPRYLDFMKVNVDNGTDLVLSLVEDDSDPRVVLITPLKRSNKPHGGMSTLDYVRLAWGASSDSLPDVVLTQTSLPGERDKVFMPGPPLSFLYRYDADVGCYEIRRGS